MGFADDTCIICENLLTIRRTIDCITKDIRQIGVEINPLKSQLLTNVVNFDYEEVKHSETIKIKIPAGAASLADAREKPVTRIFR